MPATVRRAVSSNRPIDLDCDIFFISVISTVCELSAKDSIAQKPAIANYSLANGFAAGTAHSVAV